MHNVFVYGSLKQGFHNHKLLQAQTFAGIFKTAESRYHMENLGIYPGVIHGGNGFIQGELYIVDDTCLGLLDALEENGKTYQRELIALTGHPEPCWMYFLIKHDPVLPGLQEKFQVALSEHGANQQIMVWEKEAI